MKKKSTSHSAFFNLRILIAMFVCLASVFLPLLGFGAFSAPAQAQQQRHIITTSADPLVPAGFDCSRIHELGIDKQENFRAGAIMLACSGAKGGTTSSAIGAFFHAIKKLLAPLYGATDVNLVTGTETFPNITQSETFTAANPDNPLQIVVAYNDSRGRNANPVNLGGASVSTDGGNTFVRLTRANGQSPFDNTFGDPVILFNKPSQTWFTVWLDAACGGQGLGGYKSTTPWDPNSWTHYCIHTGSFDDRESGWVDNNPSSPFFGRMYVSWNDFNFGGGALFVRYSTDNGLTWTNSRQITTGAPFIRDVQITGDLATGDVYVAAMDEMGGGLGNRANLFYKSTDGGNSWTNAYISPTFPGPGRVTCPSPFSVYACMYPDGGGYWRHQGWGEPAALNGIVHYVYASRNTGNGDPGNVFYIRSTDGGLTFGVPFQLNTDATIRAQWQPNLSVAADGSLLAVWYDERETASCSRGNQAVPCYRMWARKSTDNGATWLAEQPLSEIISPLPDQPDPGIVPVYAGDYDYGSPVLNQHLSGWADGRVAINGASQQDAFFDRDPIEASFCDSGIIFNGGFETLDFTGWTIDGFNLPPVVNAENWHTGRYAAFAGQCGNGTEANGDSSFYQQFTVPAGGGTLSFWHWDCTTDSIAFDWQDAYITDSNGAILQTIFHQCSNAQTWLNEHMDLTPYAGQTVRIKFLVHQDGFGDRTGMYVDDVALFVPCGSPIPTPTPSPTPTPTLTVTPTPTVNPTATPTPTPTASPTPRPHPTPRHTPTPHPHPTPRPRH